MKSWMLMAGFNTSDFVIFYFGLPYRASKQF